MVRQHVTLRHRKGLVYRLLPEHFMEIFNVFIAVVQLIACFGFYPASSSNFYQAACWVFFFTCAVGSVISGHGVLESFYAVHANKESTQEELAEEIRQEMEGLEATLYFVGNVMYATASLLFLPLFNRTNERNDLTIGTGLFLAGSVLFTSATFVNAFGTTSIHVSEPDPSLKVRKLGAAASLGISMIGALLFSIGSILYFPQLDPEGCKGPHVEDLWNPITVGTDFYVGGAVLFLASSSLNLSLVFAKARAKEASQAKRQ